MKLFTKYNRINLFATVAIFLMASVAFYFLLRYIFIGQVDQDLRIEKNEIETSVHTFHKLPEIIPVHDQHTTYTAVNVQGSKKDVYESIYVFSEKTNHQVLQRRISFYIQAAGQWYLVTVSKSLEGTENLIRSTILITVCTVLLILVVTTIINRVVLKRLWQPFYNTLKNVGEFKLGGKQSLQLVKTNIDEFDTMNNTLQQSIGKAEQDYLLLREFTENAAHELQTPLAIIRSKLDVLIQEENLSQKQSEAVQAAYDAIQRLTRINQSLLLLAKIENRQFAGTVDINLKKYLSNKLKQFQELWQTRNITVTNNFENAVMPVNTTLCDILFNNLLSNAIRHNVENGTIDLTVKQGFFQIKNSGEARPLDASRMFSRFYKSNAGGDSHGLGLSIVKQICDASDCNITYNFENQNLHVFKITW